MNQLGEEQQERVKQIRERQKWRANASRQNGRTPESDNTYSDTDFLLSLLDSDSQAGGDENANIKEDFTKHLMQRHEELALYVKQECAKAIDLIEQYTRPDFYMWLLHDHAGQKSDPYKRATEAKTVLLGLINSKANEKMGHDRGIGAKDPASTAPVVDNIAIRDLFALLEQDSQGQWCFKSLSRDAAKFQNVIERLATALLPRGQVVQWCDNCGSKQIVSAAAATAAPVEQSADKIETHLGELPFSLIDEIHERRQTIYRGIDYRLSPDVAAKLKTDLDYLMAFVVVLRQCSPASTRSQAIEECIAKVNALFEGMFSLSMPELIAGLRSLLEKKDPHAV